MVSPHSVFNGTKDIGSIKTVGPNNDTVLSPCIMQKVEQFEETWQYVVVQVPVFTLHGKFLVFLFKPPSQEFQMLLEVRIELLSCNDRKQL